jgi:hypothetical protein
MITIHVAVIEWETSEDPSIMLGMSWRKVAAEAARLIQAVRGVGDVFGWLHEADTGRLDDPAAMTESTDVVPPTSHRGAAPLTGLAG